LHIPPKLLRNSIAALRGAHFLAYLNGMSRSLRSGRLALELLATFLRDVHHSTSPA
jgi:hypothetical protein